MLADYHVHTAFSDDSVYPLEEVIRDAIRMGMDENSLRGADHYPDRDGVRDANAYDLQI